MRNLGTPFFASDTVPVLGFRNRIINGDMRIDQRNAGASLTIPVGSLTYTVDRFYAYSTGAFVTGQRVAGTGSTQNRYQITGQSGVTAVGFGQRIEQANSYDLAGNSAVLSVDLANSLLTTVTWTAYYANSADTFGTLASPTRTQIATGTFTVSSSVARYSATMSIPAAATTGIEIRLTVGAQTSGTWTIGNVQFELGAVATAFEKRLFAFELAESQRYYCINAPGTGGWGTTTALTTSFAFPVAMRVAPIASLINGSVNGGSALDPQVAQRVISSIGSVVSSPAGVRLDVTTSAVSSIPRPGIVEAGTLAFNAEM